MVIGMYSASVNHLQGEPVMKQETVSFPPGLKQQAQEAARKNHISFAAFVRQAVAEKLHRQEVKQHVKSA